jgi:hypothetical protein
MPGEIDEPTAPFKVVFSGDGYVSQGTAPDPVPEPEEEETQSWP